jgi:hypothetical protein
LIDPAAIAFGQPRPGFYRGLRLGLAFRLTVRFAHRGELDPGRWTAVGELNDPFQDACKAPSSQDGRRNLEGLDQELVPSLARDDRPQHSGHPFRGPVVPGDPCKADRSAVRALSEENASLKSARRQPSMWKPWRHFAAIFEQERHPETQHPSIGGQRPSRQAGQAA